MFNSPPSTETCFECCLVGKTFFTIVVTFSLFMGSAASVYVSPTGNDSGSRDKEHPLRTLMDFDFTRLAPAGSDTSTPLLETALSGNTDTSVPSSLVFRIKLLDNNPGEL